MKNKGIIIAIVIAILILIAVIVVYFTSKKKEDKPTDVVSIPSSGGGGSTVAVDSIDDDTPIYTKVLNRGIPKCIEVKMLQQRLNAMGASLEDDGVFGPMTERALQTYYSRTSITLNDLAITPSTGVTPTYGPTENNEDTAVYIWNPFTWGWF